MQDLEIIQINLEGARMAAFEHHALPPERQRGEGFQANHPVFPDARAALRFRSQGLFASKLIHPNPLAEIQGGFVLIFGLERRVVKSAVQAPRCRHHVILDVIGRIHRLAKRRKRDD